DWLKAIGSPWGDPAHSGQYGHMFLMVQAAIAGLGIALAPKVLVDRALADGSLVMLPAPAIESREAYYLLTRKRHWNLRKVRRFREWILAEAANGSPPAASYAAAPGSERMLRH